MVNELHNQPTRLVVIVLFVSLVIQICVVNAVDHSRFKTCEKSGFCSRNRDYASQSGKSPYEIVPNSISESKGKLTATLIHLENHEEFQLTLTDYENNAIRVQITEKSPLHPRYEVHDVIQPSAKQTHQSPEYQDETSILFGKLQILSSPFGLTFLSDGEPVIRANSRGFFNIEHYREPTPDPGVPSEQDESEPESLPPTSPFRKMNSDRAWEESFGGHVDSKKRGPSSVSMDFTFLGSQHVFGIPEHASSFSLQSTSNTGPYRLYNLDVFEYELQETMALYGSIPLMISHRPGKTTAVFWLNASETWVDIQHQRDPIDGENVHTHWFSESGTLDFFVLLGPSPKEVFSQYASLTGTQELPPEFAIGYHQCRWNYRDEADVSTVHQKFDEYDLPFDVIWLDIEHTNKKKYFTWDPVKFPSSKAMIDSLAEKGRKMVTIVDPHILKEPGYHIYDGGERNKFWVRKSDGISGFEGHCWPGTSMYLDFTDSLVRDYWAAQYTLQKYAGSTLDLFIWNDMNEPSVFNGPEVTMQKDLIHSGGIEHRDLHNQFGAYVHQATQEGLQKRNPTNPHRSFVLSRAFFAGSQRFGAIWTGDNTADWGHLEASLPMLLSVSVAGISFCGADVGGFFGNPDEELLVRWYQAGAFQPFFRAHAHLETKRREPYLYSGATLTNIREAIRSRYRFLPYWYTLFQQASQNGFPVMRPLWVEYPEDQEVYSMENQYLLGSDLLVHPVTHQGESSVKVYFPRGSEAWYDVETWEKYSANGNYFVVDTPMEKIPVYQRVGSIIPRKDRARRSSSMMKADPFTLVVALNQGQYAEGTLYLDDGISFAHEQGLFLERKFIFDQDRLVSVSVAKKNSTSSSGTALSSSDAIADLLHDERLSFLSSVVVEKIIILGLNREVTSCEVEQQGFKISAQIFRQGNAYIVKKPNAMIAHDWKISFLP